jgi:intraflagellar transport protein 140
MYEVSKDWDNAIAYYEKSGTFRREVPRMLLEARETERLEEYI